MVNAKGLSSSKNQHCTTVLVTSSMLTFQLLPTYRSKQHCQYIHNAVKCCYFKEIDRSEFTWS
jgi:hypothetical protein